MSKPPGLDFFGPRGVGLYVTRPTDTENKIYEAVEAAVDSGMSADRFLREVRECWRLALQEKIAADDRALRD